jgi:rubrerythrin
MPIRALQRRAVDSIKRHALLLSLDSPRAQAHILTEYLWAEEGAETAALHRSRTSGAPPEWVDRMLGNQLADEERHARLFRERLHELGARSDREAPSVGRVKVWWIARATERYMTAFEAGPIVVLLAVAAQLEGTGVRMFGRHLAVLEQYAPDDRTTAMLRQIVADEKRHARSCANALDRLVTDDERPLLDELRDTIGRIDRSFGITVSLGFWCVVAAYAARDRAARIPVGRRVVPVQPPSRAAGGAR